MRRQKCMTPGCNEHPRVRHICDSCYQSLSRLVRLKRITWAEAEKRKLCAPARRTKAYEAVLGKK